MAGFVQAVLERVRQAQAALEAAYADEDAFGAAVAQEELDDALRLAEQHGIAVDAGADEG
ncbi:hypothetical protein ACWGI8_18285 [Streptomyces sp. NPDC054841]